MRDQRWEIRYHRSNYKDKTQNFWEDERTEFTDEDQNNEIINEKSQSRGHMPLPEAGDQIPEIKNHKSKQRGQNKDITEKGSNSRDHKKENYDEISNIRDEIPKMKDKISKEMKHESSKINDQSKETKVQRWKARFQKRWMTKNPSKKSLKWINERSKNDARQYSS